MSIIELIGFIMKCSESTAKEKLLTLSTLLTLQFSRPRIKKKEGRRRRTERKKKKEKGRKSGIVTDYSFPFLPITVDTKRYVGV